LHLVIDTMNELQAYYSSRSQVLTNDIHKIRGKLRAIGWLRLLVFLLLIFTIFGVIPKIVLAGTLLSSSFLVLFFFLVKIHLKHRERLHLLNGLHAHAEKELRAIEYDFHNFDTGEEFIDPSHEYSYDMDLFGEGSIFQLLNRTTTYRGKYHLAQLLSNETLDRTVIEKRQEAIQELSEYQEQLQIFRATGTLFHESEQDLDSIQHWISRKPFFTEKTFYKVIARFIPPVILILIFLTIFYSELYSLLIILFLFNLFSVSRILRRTNEEHQIISKPLNSLRKYASLIRILEKNKFKSAILKQITETLITGQSSAAQSITKLSHLVSAFDNRMNILAAVFLEGILLWDVQCMMRFEKWRIEKGSYFDRWMSSLAEFDTLCTLAIFKFNHPEFVYPVITENPILEASDLGHILIPESERVCNDFTIKNKGEFVIITGANMAGKSTFLRTVATNMIMAMTGSPVCASSFRFHPMPIFTSMRTSDSLNKHESYFYAELKRLKDMLDRLRNNEQLFVLLDELLKGTNSYDKQKGSLAALNQIIKFGGTGIIATHDLELAKIEKKYPSLIKNLCFEIEIAEAEISFDYKLREGITKKMNALLLMQQMGIIT